VHGVRMNAMGPPASVPSRTSMWTAPAIDRALAVSRAVVAESL